MTPNYDYGTQTNYMLFFFFIFSLLCSKVNLFFSKLPFLIVLIVYDLRCAQNQCINVQNRLYQLMQFSKELVFFRTPLSYCLFIMFINFYFCCDIVFFQFQVFLLLKRHYIGFFGIAIVYSCVRSTSANMFSANWESLPQFDKNVCLFVCLFF